MAVATTHDVIDLCNQNQSAVFVCSLDAEGAFDSIPHSILFQKAMDIINDRFWRLLYYWYQRLTVHVKWASTLGDCISVRSGTRQGGLSSPFLFNFLYQDLMNILSDMDCGISLGSPSSTLAATLMTFCCVV